MEPSEFSLSKASLNISGKISYHSERGKAYENIGSLPS